MSKIKILIICMLSAVVLSAGVVAAQENKPSPEEHVIGFGSGTGFGSGGGFGSSAAMGSFGGSMNSGGTANSGYGFGAGFSNSQNSGPLSAGNAALTGTTGRQGGGWSR